LERRGKASDIKSLTLLAVASGLFAAFFEALWTWVYHGYAPLETLGFNFSLLLGVSPAWEVLALGLLIASAAFIQQAVRSKRRAAA
jgi:hypothetical protein